MKQLERGSVDRCVLVVVERPMAEHFRVGTEPGPQEDVERNGPDAVLRTYGIGAQILRDLGLTRIRVLSAPKQMYAISGFDLEITEYVEH